MDRDARKVNVLAAIATECDECRVNVAQLIIRWFDNTRDKFKMHGDVWLESGQKRKRREGQPYH